MFVNRQEELDALERWWDLRGGAMALIWGRRRVGKTALLQRFADGRRAVFHTASRRPLAEELERLATAAAPALQGSLRAERRFVSWEDALITLGEAAQSEPLLLVIDEFPELVDVTPDLPSTFRAVWDRLREQSRLKVLLSGSAVRTMEGMQEARAPLYGRFDLRLLLQPFRPHEAARMLPDLAPSERALVWGLLGGVPQYLRLWDQRATLRENLAALVCNPSGALLAEGELFMASEADLGDVGQQVLYAIAAGRTTHSEIADAVRRDPTRTLERLLGLRLIERVIPVTEDIRRTRRRVYRLADNFLAFWLGVIDRYRGAIERGLGASVVEIMAEDLDDHLGPRWEEAFRAHLVRLAAGAELGDGIVAVGPWWTTGANAVEIDAVALAGRARTPVLVGEAKWSRRVNGERLAWELERKAQSLPGAPARIRTAICGRERVEGAAGSLVVTAGDMFSAD